MRILFFSLILLSLIDEISAPGSLNVFFGDSFRQNIVKQANSSDVCTEMTKLVNATNASFTVISRRISDLERKLDDLLRTISSPKAKIVNSTCPTRYEFYYQEKFCYKFHSDCVTWDEANIICNQEGGELITITEVNFMYFRDVSRSKAGDCRNVWVGTTDKDSEGQWFWANGKKVNNVFWGQDQPDNGGKTEHCGDLSQPIDYKMDDIDCTSKHHYICKIV